MCSKYTMAKHGEKSNEVDSTTTTPKTARVMDRIQRRRIMKHMVEKRRRNRINDCLDKMRILVLKAQNKNPENYTKMEKADILEMTVNFLYVLNQQKQANDQAHKMAGLPPPPGGVLHPVQYPRQALASPSQSTSTNQGENRQFRSMNVTPHSQAYSSYARGFARCQAEVNRYLSQQGLSTPQTPLLMRMGVSTPIVAASPLCSPSAFATSQSRRPADLVDSFVSPGSTSECTPEFKPTSSSTPAPEDDINVLDTSVWRPW